MRFVYKNNTPPTRKNALISIFNHVGICASLQMEVGA